MRIFVPNVCLLVLQIVPRIVRQFVLLVVPWCSHLEQLVHLCVSKVVLVVSVWSLPQVEAEEVRLCLHRRLELVIIRLARRDVVSSVIGIPVLLEIVMSCVMYFVRMQSAVFLLRQNVVM